MSLHLQIDSNARTPKYKQIVRGIIEAIERGQILRYQQLPSINELSEEYYIARDTVEKAYKELKAGGIIGSVKGKGFYVLNDRPKQLKVLLLMNKLSAYKKAIYENFVATLGNQATISLHIHHGNARIFHEILRENLGQFHYYVVMPHFYEDTDKVNPLELLRQIRPQELMILDKLLPEWGIQCAAVYQDFTRDIYHALESGQDLLAKYQEMVLIFPKDVNYPSEIVQGVRNFCVHHQRPFRIAEKASDEKTLQAKCFIVLEDTDLAELVKKAKNEHLNIGKEVGIVAFNDTPLKEVLADGITVISTDHAQMGKTAAEILLSQKATQIKNPFRLIKRNSL
ncbi:MAG: GntR family transcriptional regulator [Runella sp.]